MVVTYFCPWTLNLHIAIVLLCPRVYYSVDIKCYKSRIRIIIKAIGFPIMITDEDWEEFTIIFNQMVQLLSDIKLLVNIGFEHSNSV